MRAAIRWGLVLLVLLLHGVPASQAWRRRSIPVSFGVPPKLQVAQAAPLFHEEFVAPDLPLAMAHVASVCELPGERLAAAWYAGSAEGARDVAIYFAVRKLGEQASWSKPQAIVTPQSAAQELNRYIKKVGNAVLFSETTGRLWLVYVTTTLGGWASSSLNVKMSVDDGETWTRSQRLTLSPLMNLSELVKNKPVALSDGSWVLPIYHEFIGKFPELLWLRTGGGHSCATKTRIAGGRSAIQPALVPLDSRTALAFFRDCGPLRRIPMSRTTNAGLSWSGLQPLDLPNPDSGLDVLRLADGRILLAFNDLTSGRENLRLAMSVDEGRTWSRLATLAKEAGDSVSYPFLIQTGDGNIHLVFTWRGKAVKHLTFNPAWLDVQRKQVSS